VKFFHQTSTYAPSLEWDADFTAEISSYLHRYRADFGSLDKSQPYNCELTAREFEHVVGNLKDSSPGADGIPPWFFRNSGESARKVVLTHCRTAFAQGRLPDKSKEADLVPLQKAGRDLTLEKSHRPISLLLVITRVCEAIINRRFYHWSETNFHIPDSQFGFRHHSSSVHPLLVFTQQIRAGFLRGQQTVMVRLDIEKAYDKIFCDGLRHTLHRMGLRGRLLSFISNFLQGRRYRVVRPAVTEFLDFNIGLPQGSSLSPILFTIFIAECAHLLECPHVEWADDITLWYTGGDHSAIISMLNRDLRTIESWARRLRVSFGDKSEYFTFYKRGNTVIDVDRLGGLRFFSKQIRPADKCVLLGVHFDHELTFGSHIDHLEAAATRRVNRLRSLRGARLVNNAEALLILYKGWIRPLLEYASEVFCTIAPSNARRLEQVQSACLRSILGARKNTPAVIVNNECGVSSLATRRSQAVLRTFYKILAMSDSHPLRVQLAEWMESDRIFEAIEVRPLSYFGAVVDTHQCVLKSLAPATLPGFRNVAPLPPWNHFHLDFKLFDVQRGFRISIRHAIRGGQMLSLRATAAASQYVHWHPSSRRDWMRCLPKGGLHLRIISRLRSGYADVGPCGHYGDVLPCPGCGGADDIPHMLRDCPAYADERTRLYAAIEDLLGHPVTMTDLLGFSSTLSATRLRDITTLTAKFVVAIRRFV